MDDLISRQAAIDSVRAGVLSTATLYGRTEEGETARKEIERTIKALPSVNPQANNEDIHREREQAYMKGYEDASKRYRTEPCDDAISRKAAYEIVDNMLMGERNHKSKALDEIKFLPSVMPAQNVCKDAISRQAVLNYIWNDLELGDEENGADLERKMELEESYRYIKALPSVTLQSKTGHWIDTGSGRECSECGEIQYGYDSFRKYCANCGAKMIEPKESEEE